MPTYRYILNVDCALMCEVADTPTGVVMKGQSGNSH